MCGAALAAIVAAKAAPHMPENCCPTTYQPDTDFYDRFISEITLCLRIHKPGRRWLALVIYPSRSVEKQAGIEF